MKVLHDFYFTFGQAHVVCGQTFEKDSVCHILAESYEEARQIAFDTFGPKWARHSRGVISLND